MGQNDFEIAFVFLHPTNFTQYFLKVSIIETMENEKLLSSSHVFTNPVFTNLGTNLFQQIFIVIFKSLQSDFLFIPSTVILAFFGVF